MYTCTWQVLLDSLIQLLQGSQVPEVTVAISGVTQLYTMDCVWESHEDELDKYQQTLADSLQGSLTAIQQALVDTTWPCSLRVLLPSLLASMLAVSPHGSQITSHPWHLEK